MKKDVTKGLSLKAIGLYVVMHKYPGIAKTQVLKDYKEGNTALKAAYKELVEKGLIELRHESGGRGIFKTGYKIVGSKALEDNPKPALPGKPKVKKSSVKVALAFYDQEVEKSLGTKLEKQYWAFVEYLKGSNPREKQLDHILELKEPMSFKRFEVLHAKAHKNGHSISDMMDSMANTDKYTKDRANLYLILNNWAK